MPQNGIVIVPAVKAPGAMHDSTIEHWGDIYKKLQNVYGRSGGRFVMDSAFSKGNHPFLIKYSLDYVINAENVQQISEGRQATATRKAAEWGTRALQGSFLRLKDRLTYEESGERRAILLFVTLLFIFRTSVVGLNQILNKYMPTLSVDANHFLSDKIGFPKKLLVSS